MLRVPSNVAAPTTATIAFQTPTFGVDLSTVTAVNLQVLRRDGTSATWAMSIIAATPAELIAQYEFQPGDVTVTGVYYLAPQLSVPGGVVSAETVSLFVSYPTGSTPMLETSAWIVATVPIASLGPIQNAWQVVSAAYTARPETPWVAVDLRTAPVAVTLWSATDGASVVVSDVYRAAASNNLTLVAASGQRVPVGDGTYAQTATYSTAGIVWRLKLASNLWLPW